MKHELRNTNYETMIVKLVCLSVWILRADQRAIMIYCAPDGAPSLHNKRYETVVMKQPTIKLNVWNSKYKTGDRKRAKQMAKESKRTTTGEQTRAKQHGQKKMSGPTSAIENKRTNMD